MPQTPSIDQPKSVPDDIDLSVMRQQADKFRKGERRSILGIFALVIACFASALVWSYVLHFLGSPDVLSPSTILGFSIWFGFFELPILAFSSKRMISELREQHRVNTIFNKYFPNVPPRERLLSTELSMVRRILPIILTYAALLSVFAILLPYTVGSLIGGRDELLWLGFGLHAYFFMVSIEVWLGEAFLVWLRPDRYPPDIRAERRQRTILNWLIALFIAEVPIFLVLAAGGRSPNWFHFLFLFVYSFSMMIFINTYPLRWVEQPLKQHNFEQALRRVRAVERLRPYLLAARYLEGSILARNRQFADAEAIIMTALGECPEKAHTESVLLTLGNCYDHAKRYEESRKVACALIECQPHHAIGYGYLAELYADHIPHPQRALELINISIEQMDLTKRILLHKTEVRAMNWAIRGWILQQLGKADEADQALKHAWSIPLQNEPIILAEVNYRTGLVFVNRGDHKMARHYLTQTMTLYPDSGISNLAKRQLEKIHAQTDTSPVSESE
jgi:tetratricopeptide (TPR) repeat protein